MSRKSECFCGCGQRVGFTQRGVNKQGRRTLEQLEKLRGIETRTEGLRAAGDSEFEAATDRFLGVLRLLIGEGEGYVSAWKDIVHFDINPDEGIFNFKSAWNAWGRATFAFAPVYKSQDDQVLRSAILDVASYS